MLYGRDTDTLARTSLSLYMCVPHECTRRMYGEERRRAVCLSVSSFFLRRTSLCVSSFWLFPHRNAARLSFFLCFFVLCILCACCRLRT